MRRRPIALAAPLLLASRSPLLAQPAGRLWRIGVLLHNIVFERFRLRSVISDVGLQEGRHFEWVVRSSGGQADRLDALAAELVASGVDLIVAPNNLEIQAAMRATRTIPIVMMYATAPVETGLVAALARPGGNVTGTTTNVPEMAGKMIEVMHDLLPRMARMTYLYEPDYPGMPLYQRAAERAAAVLRIRLEGLAVRVPGDLDAALATLEREQPDAILVSMTGPLLGGFRRVISFAAAHRLPAIYSTTSPIAEGGLLAYAFDSVALVRRTSAIVDKVLRGARPADIPVEEPATFQLAINLKTAAAMGLTVPPTFLLRATEVVR
jgi:putative ABC transport system substrate-binding protein